MSLETELQRVLELNNPWDECKKKLIGTWVVINKQPMCFIEVVDAENSVVCVKLTDGKKAHITVETLDTFLPESGLYPLSDGSLVLLVKKPKRQWRKSFNEEFYSVKCVGEKSTLPKPWLSDVFSNKVADILCDKKGNIYYWENLIGRREKTTIICLDATFEQELLDWRREYANNVVA